MPSEYGTINQALDASVLGDTVLVAPGNYTDYETRGLRTSCAFLKDGVTLKSESGSQVTTLNFKGLAVPTLAVMTAMSHTSGATRIEGFTIANAPEGSGGVNALFCETVTVSHCVIRNMTSTLGGIGVIANSSSVMVQDCSFVENSATHASSILGVDRDLVVERCQFVNNAGSPIRMNYTGGPAPSVVIRESVFTNNSGTGSGAIELNSAGTIEHCIFEGNVAVDGTGAVASRSGAIICNNVFLDNSGTGNAAGGALSTYGVVTVDGNTFYGSTKKDEGPGSTLWIGNGWATVTNNVFANSGPGATVHSTAASVDAFCNLFWNNAGPNTSGTYASDTDVFADPEFCAAEMGILTVSSSSPCLPENSGGCGQIGALGKGCEPVTIEALSWGAIKKRYWNRY